MPSSWRAGAFLLLQLRTLREIAKADFAFRLRADHHQQHLRGPFARDGQARAMSQRRLLPRNGSRAI